MKSKREMDHTLVYIFLIVLAVIIVSTVFVLFLAFVKVQDRRERLLCETDYHILLDACRELSKRNATGDLKSDIYWVRKDKEPKASQFNFPRVIMDTEPLFVEIIDEGIVRLEMAGLPMYGVTAFPNIPTKPLPFGDVELIPGLWYYDEDYNNFKHPKHKKRIDAMIQRGEKKQEERDMDN